MGKEFNPHRIFSVFQNGPCIIVLFTNMATETSCKCQRVITPVKTSYFLTIIRVIILDVKTCEVFLCFLAIIFLGSFVLTSMYSLLYVTREFNRFLHRG